MGRELDPFASFRFKVEVGGVIEAHFQSVSGLSAETEVVAKQEGGVNDHVHQLKGKTTYGKIVLKRGVTTSRKFFNWMQMSVRNAIGRQQGTITLYDEAGQVKQTWSFLNGWPCKWEGGSFDTTSSAALIETLEIAHEGLQSMVIGDFHP